MVKSGMARGAGAATSGVLRMTPRQAAERKMFVVFIKDISRTDPHFKYAALRRWTRSSAGIIFYPQVPARLSEDPGHRE